MPRQVFMLVTYVTNGIGHSLLFLVTCLHVEFDFKFMITVILLGRALARSIIGQQ